MLVNISQGLVTARSVSLGSGATSCVRLRLTGATSYLLSVVELTTGEPRSRAAACVLRAALNRDRGHAFDRGLVDRPAHRVPERLRLPKPLARDLATEASDRGWSVDTLVEYLCAEYVAAWAGQLLAALIWPVRVEGPDVLAVESLLRVAR